VLAFVDTGIGILAVSEAVDDGDGFGQLAAVLVVLLVLTTALPPILRRLQRPAPAPAACDAALAIGGCAGEEPVGEKSAIQGNDSQPPPLTRDP
jgi:hypothetical protein